MCSWEDGQGKRGTASRSYRDKRIGECVCSVSIQFKSVGVLNLGKSSISPKWTFWGDYWFYPVRINATVISIKEKRPETVLRWVRDSRVWVSVNAGSPISLNLYLQKKLWESRRLRLLKSLKNPSKNWYFKKFLYYVKLSVSEFLNFIYLLDLISKRT